MKQNGHEIKQNGHIRRDRLNRLNIEAGNYRDGHYYTNRLNREAGNTKREARDTLREIRHNFSTYSSSHRRSVIKREGLQQSAMLKLMRHRTPIPRVDAEYFLQYDAKNEWRTAPSAQSLCAGSNANKFDSNEKDSRLKQRNKSFRRRNRSSARSPLRSAQKPLSGDDDDESLSSSQCIAIISSTPKSSVPVRASKRMCPTAHKSAAFASYTAPSICSGL